jgi:hypothetical protein
MMGWTAALPHLSAETLPLAGPQDFAMLRGLFRKYVTLLLIIVSEKPDDLPVQAPVKPKLVINLAKAPRPAVADRVGTRRREDQTGANALRLDDAAD